MTSVSVQSETRREHKKYRQQIISRNNSLGLIVATETSRATVRGGNDGFISSSKIKRLALGNHLIVEGPVRCPVVPRPSVSKAKSSTQIL
jgi:transcription termination factor Rho